MQNQTETTKNQEHEDGGELARLIQSGTLSEKMRFLMEDSEDVENDAEKLNVDPQDYDGEELTRHHSRRFFEWLEAEDYRTNGRGIIRHLDNLVFVDNESEYYDVDECVEVNLRGRRTEWRLKDSDDIFFCHENREWFDSDYFYEVIIDGESYCQERCDVYYWESDGEWHHEPEPEEEEEEGPLGLSSYQCGERSNVLPGRAVSLEIELVVNDPSPSFGDEIREVCDACERDGSLPDNGAEVIVGSTLVSEMSAKLDKVCAIFKRYDCNGYVEGKEGIGIHASVSRKGWDITNATLARMLILVSEGKELFEALAQRKETHWAVYFKGDPKVATAKAKRTSGEKYEAVAIRNSDRIEFRLFRSSCRKDRIMKNVETVVAVVDYCKAVANHRDVSIAGFRQFIKENAKTLPNLNQFITEKGI